MIYLCSLHIWKKMVVQNNPLCLRSVWTELRIYKYWWPDHETSRYMFANEKPIFNRLGRYSPVIPYLHPSVWPVLFSGSYNYRKQRTNNSLMLLKMFFPHPGRMSLLRSEEPSPELHEPFLVIVLDSPDDGGSEANAIIYFVSIWFWLGDKHASGRANK